MAAESCSVDDDQLHLLALCNGRNAAGLPDEEYAVELQLQEVIMSSVMAAAALAVPPADSCAPAAAMTEDMITPADSCAPAAAMTEDMITPADSCAPAAATSYEAAGECSSSASLLIPPLAPATDDATLPECLPSSAGPSIPATFFFCKICMDAVPPSDAHSASRGCGHAFCGTCLAGYIRVKIQDRMADVRCPEDGCGGVLDPELCQGMVPREVFEVWCAVMCESMVLGANNNKVYYCPFKDCSAMMVDDLGGDVAESECPSCKRLFCACCGVPWHAGVGCAEYGQLAAGDRGKEDLAVMAMAMGEKWKRCPQCKFLVQKSEGCLHITCRCGFEFCYGCGKNWASHSSCSAA